MALLETDEAAVRLARAIVADIELYHAEIITAGGDLSDPIAEGRALYRTRVPERFHAFFEDALMARNLARLDAARQGSSRPPAVAGSGSPARPADTFTAPLPNRNGGSSLTWVTLVVFVVLLGAAAWFFTRG